MGTILEKLGITPAPWELIEVGDKCPHLCPANKGDSILTVVSESDDNEKITTYGAVYYPADAYLIAAAPEMFLIIVAMLKCAKKNDMIKGAEVLTLMEEVVKKATGSSNVLAELLE